MLDAITLTDFKNHAHTHIRLSPLTLLVGPNGAGKTGVLQGLHLASEVLAPGLRAYPSDAYPRDGVIRRGADRLSLKLDGRYSLPPPSQSSEWMIEIAVSATSDGSSFGTLGVAVADAAMQQGKLPNNSLLAEQARSALGRAAYLRLNARRLAEPSYLESASARIDSDGTGLASTIAHLMTYERDRFAEIEEELRSVVPTVDRIRVRRVPQKRPTTVVGKYQSVLADELVLDMRSGDSLSARFVSEGTLIVLGLLAVLEGTECPSLILIDDIDQALHPRAQAQLVRLLRELIDDRPGLQVVATSHSPYLMDELATSEVWVVSARQDGTAAAACLADHPDAERFRDLLRTGEFLSSVGEDWVLGEGPGDALRPDR